MNVLRRRPLVSSTSRGGPGGGLDGGALRLLRWSSAALSVLKPLGMGYVAICGAVYVFQRNLQYFPTKESPALPASIHKTFSGVREVEFVAADGTRCLGWHWPPPEPEAPVTPFFWLKPSVGGYGEAEVRRACAEARERYPHLRGLDVLLLHGNAGDRSHRLGWMHLLREGLGVSVTVLDYRGFGGSDGSPSEDGLIADGAAAAKWLRAHGGPAGRKLVLWGESIGSGVAVALSDGEASAPLSPAERPDAVIIEGGLSSCVDVAARAYPWLPVRLPGLMRDRFDNVVRARRMPSSLPVLQLHGTLDEIVPFEFGVQLHEALPAGNKRFVALEGTGHNDIPYHDTRRYLQEVAEFLGSAV